MAVFKNEYTDLFIEKFYSKTNIDKRIIENLITLQLFHKILKNQNFDYLNNNVLTDQLPELVENYPQRIEFIFASYPIVNPNFEIIHFDESSNKNRYILINNKSKIRNFLFLHFDDSDKVYTLEYFIHLNIYDYFNYSLNLTNQEIDQLKFFIRKKIQESYKYSLNLKIQEIHEYSDLYINPSYLKNEIDKTTVIYTKYLDRTWSFQNFLFRKNYTESLYKNYHSQNSLFQQDCNITLEINQRLQTYTEHLLQIKNQYSKDIDKILERALLEQKMENF